MLGKIRSSLKKWTQIDYFKVSKLVELSPNQDTQTIPQLGYGLTKEFPVLALNRQEAIAFQSKENIVEEIQELTEQDFFEESYQNMITMFSNKDSNSTGAEHLGFRTSKNREWQFMANSISTIAALWYTENKQTEGQSRDLVDFLGKLGDLEISVDKDWTDKIHENSSITYGNGGWSVSESGVFCTATEHLGRNGMEIKIEILDRFLKYSASKLKSTSSVDYLNCDNRNFLDIFNIEDETLKIILQGGDSPRSKDSEEKNRWLEANTNPISDDVFEELLVDKEKWSSWEECQFYSCANWSSFSTNC